MDDRPVSVKEMLHEFAELLGAPAPRSGLARASRRRLLRHPFYDLFDPHHERAAATRDGLVAELSELQGRVKAGGRSVELGTARFKQERKPGWPEMILNVKARGLPGAASFRSVL